MANKRSVALDITTPDGHRLLFDLVEHCDVVWTNQKPSTLKRLGITFESLEARNPRVVYATLSGFGHDDLLSAGPLADLRAFDVIAQGLGGLQFRGSGPEGVPSYNGLALGDEVTSTLTVLGIILALYRRERHGGAQRVDVAMHDAMVFLNELSVGMMSVFGQKPPRGRSGTSAPYGAFRTRDGWVNIGVGGNPVWARFCAAIERPEARPRRADRVLSESGAQRGMGRRPRHGLDQHPLDGGGHRAAHRLRRAVRTDPGHRRGGGQRAGRGPTDAPDRGRHGRRPGGDGGEPGEDEWPR